MEELILKAEKREAVGGLTAKKLRKQGLTPAIIYGHGESRNVSVNYHDFEMLMHTMHSEHALVKLKIDTDELHVLVKDCQRDVVTHNVIHIDFLVVRGLFSKDLKSPQYFQAICTEFSIVIIVLQSKLFLDEYNIRVNYIIIKFTYEYAIIKWLVIKN